MASDPAFLFYPGDYLRDTQCLSEQAQVAYDRIMCEHMRNICISEKLLNFFTKRLTPDQRAELEAILEKVPDGYRIGWVAESIEKRREYSESRRKNRTSSKKSYQNISSSYVPHMENANEIENENRKGDENESFDDRFLRAFDELTCERFLMTFKEIPKEAFGHELQLFRTKCDNDPNDYHNRDIAGLRHAFQYQLKNFKHGKRKPTQQDLQSAVDEAIKRRNSKGTA